MCGIAAKVGKDSVPFVLEALKRLEYRGYDSWGLATEIFDGSITTRHFLGGPSQQKLGLEPWINDAKLTIGHNRWSTHGKPSLKNAHPVEGGNRECFVVHNGIIEKHDELRKDLEYHGFKFKTDTDTECIAHLLAYALRHFLSPARALEYVVEHLQGQYAFAAICKKFPGRLLVAANNSPLLVSPEGFVASDLVALSGYTSRCYRLRDKEYGILSRDNVAVYNMQKFKRDVEFDCVVPNAYKPRDSACHMREEIHEQPQVALSPLPVCPEAAAGPDVRYVLFGCGSSYNAALLGRHFMEGIARRPTQVEYATEFPGLMSFDTNNTFYVALTQSGETLDTIMAMKGLPRNRLAVLTNNPQSTATRWGHPITLDCGPEVGVAATKTFTAQAVRLYQIASRVACREYHESLQELSDAIKLVLSQEDSITLLTSTIMEYRNILYLGRGLLYPIAREGALKMTEVSYRHAQAMPASEMKHGPIALIDDRTLSVVLVGQETAGSLYKICDNINEILARNGRVIAVADQSAALLLPKGVATIVVPTIKDKWLVPLLINVVLQLLSYHVATRDGLDVDKPRNLAKAVTV